MKFDRFYETVFSYKSNSDMSAKTCKDSKKPQKCQLKRLIPLPSIIPNNEIRNGPHNSYFSDFEFNKMRSVCIWHTVYLLPLCNLTTHISRFPRSEDPYQFRKPNGIITSKVPNDIKPGQPKCSATSPTLPPQKRDAPTHSPLRKSKPTIPSKKKKLACTKPSNTIEKGKLDIDYVI